MNPVQACDVLASHPDDPEAYAAGVSNLRLEHDKVIKACEAAIKLDKKSPRLNFQLARGYLSANRLEEAIEQLLSAAKQGHGGALGFLGDIYLDGGPGIEPNPSIAKGLYARSAESGFEPAKKLLAEFEDYTEKVAAAERELKASPKSTTATASGPKTIPGYANAFTSTYQGPKLTDSKGSCTPESVFAPQMRRTGYMMAVSALQVFINSKAHQTWLTSTHDIEGDSVIGEELDEFLDINTDRNTIARAEALMKEKGMGDARIGQETNQMQNFLYLLLKKRFDAIVESKNLFFIYSQGSNGIGLLTTEIGDSVCVVDKLTEVDIRNYTSTRLPSWIKPDSNFAKAVEEYRKTLSYGVTAFGKMSNGNTFIVLSLPRYKPGAYGGPVPYLFAGVVLVGNETKEHKPAVFGNLMHVQYGVSFHPDHIGK